MFSIPGFPDKPDNSIIDKLISFNPTKKGAISVILRLFSHLHYPPVPAVPGARLANHNKTI